MPAPYVFDHLGTNPDNRITNELHVVTVPVDPTRGNFIVPRAAPFFLPGLVLRTGPNSTGTLLVDGVDYILTHRFVEAFDAFGGLVYGSITFLNPNYSGNVYLRYQTIGQPYTLADYSVVESLTHSLYNTRTVTWTQIVGMPVAFPPEIHNQPITDIAGYDTLCETIDDLTAAIILKNNPTNVFVAKPLYDLKTFVGSAPLNLADTDWTYIPSNGDLVWVGADSISGTLHIEFPSTVAISGGTFRLSATLENYEFVSLSQTYPIPATNAWANIPAVANQNIEKRVIRIPFETYHNSKLVGGVRSISINLYSNEAVNLLNVRFRISGNVYCFNAA